MTLTPAKKVLLLCGVFTVVFTTFQKLPATESTSAAAHQQASTQPKTEIYGPPRVIAEITVPDINESSGLIASRLAGVYWTHNDSGDGPFIYAVDERGRSRGVWRVVGAAAHDWEDIAAGPGPRRDLRYLYIGDIGDNSGGRSEIVVYRIPEPPITAADVRSTRNEPRLTEPAEPIRFRYPDGSHDAETLLVHPVSGNLYVITKLVLAKPVVYKATAPLRPGHPIVLVRKGDLSIPSLLGGLITGGNISPDGRRVALCDYLQGYELVLPAASTNFDDIWDQRLIRIDLGRRKQGESITYRLDGKALLATSEGSPSPLIEVLRR